MYFKGLKIGFALTGSFCTVENVLSEMKNLVHSGAELTPILSTSIQRTDTRFGNAQQLLIRLKRITGKSPLQTLVEVEPIGPKELFDLLIIAPCTGNTLAKIALAITDDVVPMATKAHLRNDRPVVIAVATNDGLGNNARNIGLLLNFKNIFFVPFGQDNPVQKRNSLISRMELMSNTAEYALRGEQLQPVLIQH